MLNNREAGSLYKGRSFYMMKRLRRNCLLNYQENSSVKYVLLVSHGTIAPAMHETANAFFLVSGKTCCMRTLQKVWDLKNILKMSKRYLAL